MVITAKLQSLKMYDSQVLKSKYNPFLRRSHSGKKFQGTVTMSEGIETCEESTSGESFPYRFQLEEDVKRLQLQLQQEIDLHTFLESVMEKDSWELSYSSSVPHPAQELLSNIVTLETAVTKLEQEMMSLNFQLSQERNERRLAEYHLTHSASPLNSSSSLRYLNQSDSDLHQSAEDSPCQDQTAQDQESSSESSPAESTVEQTLDPSNDFLEKRLMRKTIARKLPRGMPPKHLWDHPNLLSEEMVRCMKNIFMSLADPTATSKASSNESHLSPVSPRGHLSSSASWWPSTERSMISSWVQSPQIDIQNNANVLATGDVFDPYRVRGKLSWAEIGSYSLASEVSWMSVGKKQLEYASGALRKFRTLVEQLARVNPIHLSCNEKLAFWINLYNALIMHAYLAYGVPKSDLKLFSLMQKAAYTVGGHSYTAATMEYVILKMKPPMHRPQIALLLAIHKMKVSEEQRRASIDTHEPLLGFALSCGMYSSPAVRIYTAKGVKEELLEAQRDFIQASVGLSSKGKLLVPKMLHCYAKSLVEDSSLGVWISRYLPPHQAAFVEQCISQRRQSLLASRNCGILPFDSRFSANVASMASTSNSNVNTGTSNVTAGGAQRPTLAASASIGDIQGAASQPNLQKSYRQSSASTSMTPSPLASRESSPSRHPRRTTSATPLTSRPRKNSNHQDISPTRQMQIRASAPIRSASSRSLSSAATPSLPPSSDPQIQAPTPLKPVASESRESPRWPVSPRLRSPPPVNTTPGAGTRRNEPDPPPMISIQKASPAQHPTQPAQDPVPTTSGSDTEESTVPSGTRTPARSALETVQEVSLPNSPSPSSDAALMARVGERLGSQPDGVLNGPPSLQPKPQVTDPEKEAASDTNSSTPKPDRRTSSGPPPMVQRQSSALSSRQFKSKPDNSSQNMTVETETVTSIPQVALASGPKSSEGHALKAKPSTETIKPRKEKRKPTRKQINVSSGNASSKADVFEAKIASAVDEANTSDSEETFVYDSNPPDAAERSGRRFHSRTPSATSMASQADRQHFRSIHGIMEGSGAPAHGPKKGMKFVNTLATAGSDNMTADDDGKGTGRSAGGSGRGTVRHHHHIGRWGRQHGNGHASLFDNESPFPNAAKSKFAGQPSRNSSGPPSPRGYLTNGLRHKRSNYQLSNYDADEATTGADDERTPLMGPGSARRAGTSRRRAPHSLRQAEAQSFDRRPSYLNRFAACLVLTMMLLLVITGAIGFMFATSQPMTDIEIMSIHNVVTSEQVLMFDLTVKAHNPNIVVITVDQANLEIFAKSEHAGTDSDWWKVPQNSDDVHILDDPINDPPDDDALRPNVLLGRITDFDSSLTFEGSLFHKGTSSSTAGLQLPYPGNGTTGGSERWERIYQDEFDLIIKGVVKYSLPLSTRVRSATVSGRTHVTPNAANDPALHPNATLDG